MHPQPYPTRPTPEPALHLLGGIWIASCPTCGWQLTTARTQQGCERRAARRRSGLPPGRLLMASTPSAKARTELNVALTYLDRAARRLACEPGTCATPAPWSASAPSWPRCWPG
jgi:hypothetical protein